MLIERGNRKNMIVLQLPFKTSAAGGGGVPLSDEECDEFVRAYLAKFLVIFTDGASPYEALAGGDIKCSPGCDRKDCLKRAQANGGDKCSGWRPRGGRDRFKKYYLNKKLAHGIVTHKKEEWVIIKKVRVHDASGKSRLIDLKHGTECVDGCWTDLKDSIPNQVRSADHERIFDYVNAWAWRARRVGQDLFRSFAGDLSTLD
jgi:hypothetical protein